MSFLRRNKADNSKIVNEFRSFAEDFMKNLNSFSVYDSFPPEGFDEDLFFEYKKYKEEARKATSSDSIEYRFNFLLKEFKRLYPFIKKEKKITY